MARRHAQRMADRGEPYHNPNLQSEVAGWETVGENVGMGWEVDSLHRAFMDSTVHRDIILSSQMTQVGVGVVRLADGRLSVVQVFRRPSGTAPTAEPAAAPAPAPSPATAPAPAPAPAPSTTAPAPPATTAPAPAPTPTTAAPAPPLDPEPSGDGEVALAAQRDATGPILGAESATAPAVVPDLAELAREVHPATWLAGFLLAAVVGGQGLVVRRLGLA